MEMTILGRTGLTVSRSGFGALPIQRLSKQDAAALLRRAWEAGINFFDTARAYSDSEEKMALGLGDVRDQIVIATKTQSNTPEGFWRDLETSLATLRTQWVEIYQFHNPDPVPLAGDPLYDCMLQAQAQGKIRFIGVTCHKLTNARQALESGLYDTIQYPLSALSTQEELDFVRDCGLAGVGVIGMKGLAGGLLTSAAPTMAYLRAFSHAVPIWGFQYDGDLDEVIALEKAPPALDGAMEARIAAEQAALAGDFCRGCGYCAPCVAQIEISMCARMPLLLRRAVYQRFLEPDWQAKMARTQDCIACGACRSRCPYGLDIPRLLKAAWVDYQAFSLAHRE